MSDPEEVQKRRNRSFSQLNEYAQCSERFRLKRLVRPRLPERPAAWLASGNAIHEVYQLWELSGRTIDMVGLYYETYDRLIEEMKQTQPDLNLWMKPPRVRKVLEHIDTQRSRGGEQIEGFFNMIQDFDWYPWEDEETTTPGVEVPFEIQLGGITIIGYIDLLRVHSDGVSVCDIKTGNRIDSILQLGLYKVALEQQYGITPSHGEYFYTKDMTLSDPYDLSRYTEEYLTELFISMDKSIEQNIFVPNPGKNCDLCPVQRFCREKGDMPIPLNWAELEDIWWV